MLSKKKLSLLYCLVFIVLIGLTGFKLAQLVYIAQKDQGTIGKNPPPNTDKYEKKIVDKCLKKNKDPLFFLECKIKTVKIYLILCLVTFLVSVIGLIFFGRRARKC